MNRLGLLGLAVLAAACTATASPTPSNRTYPDLSVINSTTIPVTLVVNGVVIETVAPGAIADPIAKAMPSLPWWIEARSPSGRVLTSLRITATTQIDAGHGAYARVALSCGELDLWSGPIPTWSGPIPTGGDCT